MCEFDEFSILSRRFSCSKAFDTTFTWATVHVFSRDLQILRLELFLKMNPRRIFFQIYCPKLEYFNIILLDTDRFSFWLNEP